MLPRFIDSWAALPRSAEYHLKEQLWFDLKGTYPPRCHPEIAKDVAAFANATGGALIIGAHEGATAPDYSKPLSAAYANEIEKQCEEAVRQFCRPSPTVHIRAIPAPTDFAGVILVVNIEPTMDQPVAARHGDDSNFWRFPIRVGSHTDFILPEQLPVYMNSKARRAKLLLLRVLEAGRAFDLFSVPGGTFKRGEIQAASDFMLETVDAEEEAAVRVRGLDGNVAGQRVTIPIDDVEAVWLQHNAKWAVRVSGCLEFIEESLGNGAFALSYVPPTTSVVSPVARAVERLSERVRDIAEAVGGTLLVEQHPRKEPTQEAIAARAHQLWLVRVARNAAGTQDNDWFRARRQLIREQRNE